MKEIAFAAAQGGRLWWHDKLGLENLQGIFGALATAKRDETGNRRIETDAAGLATLAESISAAQGACVEYVDCLGELLIEFGATNSDPLPSRATASLGFLLQEFSSMSLTLRDAAEEVHRQMAQVGRA
jgi:hypothetical protein